MRPEVFQSRFALVLFPLSHVYRVLMRLRRRLWEGGLLRRFAPPCPCISVGNISWGGTGKTPVIDWLLSWAERNYRQAVVLTRGYKGNPPYVPLVVRPQLSAAQSGDEPLMLALDHPVSVVLVDPNRRRAGRYALKNFTASLFLLDDGFQHLGVQRDLDLVLLRPDDAREGWGRVIPAGTWREGETALTRADAFLVKCGESEFSSLQPDLQKRFAGFGKPLFAFSLEPKSLDPVRPRDDRHWYAPNITEPFPIGKPYALVSGVGNPDQVCSTITRFIGYPPERHKVYPDHRKYTLQDALELENSGLPLVCTRKDAVKLRELHLSRLWALRVEVVFGQRLWSEKNFPEWIDAWWAKKKMSPERT